MNNNTTNNIFHAIKRTYSDIVNGDPSSAYTIRQLGELRQLCRQYQEAGGRRNIEQYTQVNTLTIMQNYLLTNSIPCGKL